jgi:hypothetical protein
MRMMRKLCRPEFDREIEKPLAGRDESAAALACRLLFHAYPVKSGTPFPEAVAGKGLRG